MRTSNSVSGLDECYPGLYYHTGCNRKRPNDIATMFGDISQKHN